MTRTHWKSLVVSFKCSSISLTPHPSISRSVARKTDSIKKTGRGIVQTTDRSMDQKKREKVPMIKIERGKPKADTIPCCLCGCCWCWCCCWCLIATSLDTKFKSIYLYTWVLIGQPPKCLNRDTIDLVQAQTPYDIPWLLIEESRDRVRVW